VSCTPRWIFTLVAFGLLLTPCLAQSTVANIFQLPTDNYPAESPGCPAPNGSVIAQDFGCHNSRYLDKNKKPELHVGQDVLASKHNMDVKPTAPGKVVFAQTHGTCATNWGYVLVIEHTLPDNSKVSSIYGHLDPSTVTVKEGDIITDVTRVIGKTGSYSCWKEHLHFGIYLGPYGAAVGHYAPWLHGYLTDSVFPDKYLNPLQFVEAHFNQRPTGSLDGINGLNQVFGWAEDPDNANVAVTVHLYIDKNAGTAGAVPNPVVANQFRSDVGNHAFNWDIPTSLQDGQTHTVWAWGIDLTDPLNNNALLPGSPKTFNIAPATGTVTVNATLDGKPTGSPAFTLTGPNGQLVNGIVLGKPASGLPLGSYTLTYNSGAPPNSSLTAISPCGILTRGPTCMATVNGAQSLTFTLQFTSNPPRYTITDLGTLPGNPARCVATALNNLGEVIGTCTAQDGSNSQGFVWTPSNLMIPIPKFPGGIYANPFAINDSSQIVGDANGNGISCCHAFLYSGGSLVDLGTPRGATNSTARGINNHGQILVFADTVSTGEFNSDYLYSAGAFDSVSPCCAQALNDSLQIVGTMFVNAQNLRHAFLSTAGSVTDLGILPNTDSASIGSFGMAINNLGQVVGYSGTHAFRWTLIEGMRDLGTLSNDSYSQAYGINDLGSAVGVSSDPFGNSRAFLWTPNIGLLNLNALLVVSDGWQLGGATSINNAGQIVGAGLHNGQLRAFLLTPQ
jgi:probable HAF family extracellular repeat protein